MFDLTVYHLQIAHRTIIWSSNRMPGNGIEYLKSTGHGHQHLQHDPYDNRFLPKNL